MKHLKADFPIFTNHPGLVYLDSAATSQKPQAVIDAVADFYAKGNANIHRGLYELSARATDRFEAVRQQVADFINAGHASEIIFTANATEAINYTAYGWARKHLKSGDTIVTSEMEHHSNFVPWLRLKEELGIELILLPLDKDFRLDYKSIDIDFKRVKLIALAHASNVLGTINPVKAISEFFRTKGADAKLLIDAAQSVPHLPVDVQALDADFLAFSSHKMLGPSGVGVLYAKRSLLDAMDPMLVGSHMVASVNKDKAAWTDPPDKFEPGTRNIEGVIGLGAAIGYLESIGMTNIAKHEHELSIYALEKLSVRKDVKLFGPDQPDDRIGVFSFGIKNIHAHDTAEILNRSKIAVRAGHHCAEPLMQFLGVPGTARASIYLYNSRQDIDALISGIEEVKRIFHV